MEIKNIFCNEENWLLSIRVVTFHNLNCTWQCHWWWELSVKYLLALLRQYFFWSMAHSKEEHFFSKFQIRILPVGATFQPYDVIDVSCGSVKETSPQPFAVYGICVSAHCAVGDWRLEWSGVGSTPFNPQLYKGWNKLCTESGSFIFSFPPKYLECCISDLLILASAAVLL